MPPTKQYRRYLEPGEPCRIPKQTAHYQRKIQGQQHDEDDESADLSENEHESVVSASNVADSAPSDPAHADLASSPSVSNASPPESDRDEYFDSDHMDESDSSAHCDADEDCASLEDCELRDYMEKCSAQTLPNQAITKAQALLLILTYVVHSGLSWSQMEGLLVLVNTLCSTEVIPQSKYMFRKLWKDKMQSVGMHFFCTTCLAYLGVKNATHASQGFTCTPCQASFTPQQLTKKGSFFLIFDLRRQLYDKIGLHAEELYNSLKHLSSTAYGVYTDITNGWMYTSIRSQLNMKWCDVTVSINTDGSPVFKSSKSRVWPIQLLINELPFDVRFHNVIIGALWFAKRHPPALLFMKTFVDAFNKVGSNTWQHAGQTVVSRVYATCCCVDSPARAALLRMKQFNGYFGCPWCLEEGTIIDGK